VRPPSRSRLAEQGGREAKVSVTAEHDGSDFDQAMTATIADDLAERLGYGLQLLIDGVRSQLAIEAA
jgi:hypothetical protein